MINAGVCLCLHCGNTSTEAYYTTKDIAAGAFLRKSKGIRPKYTLEVNPPSGSSADEYKFDLITKIKPGEIPDVISAHCGTKMPDSNEYQWIEARLQRSCPMCKGVHNPFEKPVGRAPMFVIACVGESGSGKSCWSASVSNALIGLNGTEDYPIILPLKLNDVVEVGRANDPDDAICKSNYFGIYDRSNQNKLIATIFLLDTAGENYHTDNLEPNSKIYRLLTGNGEDYFGIDGAIFFDPAVDIKKFDDTKKGMTAVDIFNTVVGEKISQIPVAYVRNFSDMLIIDDPASVIRKDTFERTSANPQDHANKVAYAPERLEDRIELQQQIYNNAAECSMAQKGDKKVTFTDATVFNRLAVSDNARVFLIQSCEIDEDKKNNYNVRFNVLDPLLWLINKLILNSPDEGGNV